MIQLIYVSAATIEFTEESLKELLEKARAKNMSLHVSGMLVYEEGSFLQVLEGAEAAVMSIFDKIKVDSRHDNVRLLLKNEIEERSFQEWKMGFFNASRKEMKGFPGYSDFFRKGQPFADDDGDRAKAVLLQFKEGAWRQEIDD